MVAMLPYQHGLSYLFPMVCSAGHPATVRSNPTRTRFKGRDFEPMEPYESDNIRKHDSHRTGQPERQIPVNRVLSTPDAG